MREDQKPELTWVHKFSLFAGVILPAISITLEATTHICADQFFDPIPTRWHLMLVTFVPLAQLHVWFAIRQRSAERLTLAGLINAAAIGISIFYSIVYIPLIPLAALALAVGLGLLPLAPFLSLLAGIVMRVQLKQVASKEPQKSFAVTKTGLLAGVAVTIALIGLIELPASITRYGLRMATSESAETRTRGIRFLRAYGSRDYLLRSCYRQTGWATDLIGYALSMENPVTPAEAQKIYYRITGETFDTSVPPKRTNGGLVPQEEIDFDTDQAEARVGQTLKDLSLSSSKLDAFADADGGVGYIQWTLVFQNDSEQQREARAEIQLPPGSVVSRLTLWVNGEEREAAFAGRAHVRQAYEQVAFRQRRDPVLVTTAGRDRVLVQCFPVPPNNGEMKIRLGITVPLLLQDRYNARLLLPHFIDKNFRVPASVRHSVWIEAKTLVYTLANGFISDQPSSNLFGLRGQIPEAELSKPGLSFGLSRSPQVNRIWSKDPFQTGFTIQQSIEESSPAHLQRIILVVDTSAAMSKWEHEIEEATNTLPRDFDVHLVLAGELETGPSSTDPSISGPEEMSVGLRSAAFEGGADNVPALEKAWDLAAARPGNNAIVWIHNPQLLQLAPIEELRQRWERRLYGPVLYSVAVTNGSDEIEKKLDGINEVKSVPRMESLQKDLERLFAQLTGEVKILEFVRSSKKLDELRLSGDFQTSDHLARLWANDEVMRILTPRDESLNKAATMLAVRYQLVTPVSGAVVLETAAQYSAAGLKPVEPGSVPTIPEPEMLALLIVAGVFVIGLFYFKYRQAGRGRCVV